MTKTSVEILPAAFVLGLFLYSPAVVWSKPGSPGYVSQLGISPDSALPATNRVVEHYLLNPHGEIDGLLLSDGAQIHFPPHLSDEVARAIKPGDRVDVTGESEGRPVFRASQIVNLKTNAVVTDAGPIKVRHPLSQPKGIDLRLLNTQSEIRTVLYGKHGDMTGFVLANETIVRMPPETAFRFAKVFQPGQTINVEGYGTENLYGRCIEAASIGAPGQPRIPIYGSPSPRKAIPPLP